VIDHGYRQHAFLDLKKRYKNVIKFAIVLSFRNGHGPVPTSLYHTAN
jgi:hypothetical protein